jgi:hypothetical protein
VYRSDDPDRNAREQLPDDAGVPQRIQRQLRSSDSVDAVTNWFASLGSFARCRSTRIAFAGSWPRRSRSLL